MNQILIGTMSRGNADTPRYIDYLGKLGFESTEITFGHDCSIFDTIDFDQFAADCLAAAKRNNMIISSVGIYGNPLESDDAAASTRKGWSMLLDNVHKFETDLICGFTGRLIDKPVPDSIPQYKAIFSEYAAHAKEKGVRIAFENCNMGGNWWAGNWNIAFNPAAWELMFEAFDSEQIGLEWEPAHHLCQLMDPIAQLRQWAPRVFHLHGKDATVEHDTIAKYGIMGPNSPVYHRMPGLGDSNWKDIISILRTNQYTGTIDIEGWHDKVYNREMEMTAQVFSMNYLKHCRVGDFVPNFV